MSILGKHIYRIAFRFGNVGEYWQDYETKNTFQFPSGVALKIQIGILEDEKLGLFYDLTSVASLKLQIKELRPGNLPPDPSDPAYMEKEVLTLDSATVALADWQAKTAQHATFDYTAADTTLPPGKYWMVISGTLTDSSTITPGWGKIEVVQDGSGPTEFATPV